MEKFLLFLLVVFFIPHGAHSQHQTQTKSDSLLTALHQQTRDDTARVNTLNALSREYYLINHVDTTALSYAQTALALAHKLHYKKGMAVANRYIGNYYSGQTDSAQALAYYQKALTLCKQIDDPLGMVYNLRNIGSVYQNHALYDKSIACYEQALSIARKMDNPAQIAAVYNDMGLAFITATNYPKALEYFQKALKVSENSADKLNTASTLGSIGWLYRNMGDSAHAVDYLKKSLAISRQIDAKFSVAGCLLTLGNIYMNFSDSAKAIQYYRASIEVSKTMHDSPSLATEYANVAGLYLVYPNYRAALKYLDSTKSILDKHPNQSYRMAYLQVMGHLLQRAPDSILSIIHIKPGERYQATIKAGKEALQLASQLNIPVQKGQALATLVPAYEKTGDYKTAYITFQSLITLRDSIQGQDVRKQIVQKEVEYDFEKKAAAAQALQEKKDIKQRTIRNALIAGLILSGLFLVIVFRQSNRVKKEQKRSEELLLNILPEKVAGELKQNGKAEAHRFDDITVLFTDFVNFTGTSETLAPEELVGELNECFTAFDYIIERNGLEKIKTIGDAYMAVCGLPNSVEDHAKRAVQAAVEIMDFMHQRGLKEKVFGIRIGINSGSVVAGIVGVKKFAYDIWGDAVNTAARMEQKSEPGKINISEATYALVKADFDCHFRGEIEAKNKGKLKMYFVETRQAQVSNTLSPA